MDSRKISRFFGQTIAALIALLVVVGLVWILGTVIRAIFGWWCW